MQEKGGVLMRNKPLENGLRFMKVENEAQTPLQTPTFARSRYQVFDEGGSWKDGFDIYDAQTKQRHKIDFAFCGTNQDSCTTWDFAPLGEMREVDGTGFNRFRNRLHQDDQFIEQQLMMNRRERIFHQAGEGKGVIDNGLHMFGGTFQDPITRTNFFMSSDVRFGRDIPPLLNRIEYNIAPFFKPLVRKVSSTKRFINRYLKLNRSPEDVLRDFAEKKSKQLLKSWLTESEYESLMNLGEMEIYNDDEIFIIKKNPHATIKVKKNNGRGDCQLQEEFCMITEEMGYAIGDILLTKIMMIKTDPEKFKKIAIRRAY